MRFDPTILWYGLLLVPLVAAYWSIHRRTERRSLAVREAARQASLNEPPTLHPKIDPLKCIGCGACVAACPEGDVLGLIHGKAELIAPSECIGHGACRASCPEHAIELVYGTETRGIDLPNVAPDFQTNVPGIYIAGELGGMGLIRNAIEQGRQAIAEIAKRTRRKGLYDVVIVGAGPAGFSASLAAKEKKLHYLTIEQETLGGTVAHFPRGKLVMTQPATLPLHGKIKFGEIGKEALLHFWSGIARTHKLNIAFGERLQSISSSAAGFVIRTSQRDVNANSVLLAIGRRGSPRRLGIPGEDLPHVVYRLIEPEQYRGKRVFVVGGGNSAVEAALMLSEQPGTRTTLVHRGATLGQTNLKNRERLQAALDQGDVRLLLDSLLQQISPTHVQIQTGDYQRTEPCDAVVISIGGVLPVETLKAAGVEFSTKFGTA